MKKLFVVLAIGALFSGCSSEDDPILVTNLALKSSESVIYYDSKAPSLTLTITPNNADNKDITWSSSNPEILAVDNTGTLSLKKFSYGNVTISAKNETSGQTASCQIQLAIKKADINDYKAISLKETMGFDILDRNLGATKAYSKTATAEENAQAIGDYYQFGNSIPVADASGVNSFYNKESKGGDLDWSVAANTPCPEGWRIPTMEEMKKLTNAAWVDYDGIFQSDEEYYAALDFYNSLLIMGTGYYKIEGDDEAARAQADAKLYLPKAGYFWAGELNKTDGKETSARGFKQAYALGDNNFVVLEKTMEVNAALPIRCVK
ncbi:MAG: FISUMP domain-containing protein [Bacteroidales bacterium]|nr:FISUMP domain-containing protein [Bacteroidales bacterium]